MEQTINSINQYKMAKTYLVFGLFVIFGVLVYGYAGYFSVLSEISRTVLKTGIPLLCFLLLYLSKKKAVSKEFGNLIFSFGLASIGFLTAWIFVDLLQDTIPIESDPLIKLSLTKAIDAILVVTPILMIVKFTEGNFQTVYMRTGKLKIWILVGGSSFLVFLLLFLFQARAQNLEWIQILSSLPWILIFVFLNGFMEELHFRGIFLKVLEPMLGKTLSNIAIAIVFTAVHFPVEYTADLPQFLAILFVFSLIWGYLIQKSQSLWGAVLFHAGADLMVIQSILQINPN